MTIHEIAVETAKPYMKFLSPVIGEQLEIAIERELREVADSVKEKAAKVSLEYGRAKYNNSIEEFASEQIAKKIRQMEIK